MSHDTLADKETVQQTIEAMVKRNIQAMVVETSAEALAKVKELVPAGASIMNGSSTTLEQIGFVAYLKSGTHGWNNVHEAILAETDPAKQALLRKQAVLSDFYVGSVHALAQTGELVIASNTGSQLPHIVFTSPNIIFVIGTQKITPTLADALSRLEEYVKPLEDERARQAYGVGTADNKIVIFKGENPMMGRKVQVIFVNEKLGF